MYTIHIESRISNTRKPLSTPRFQSGDRRSNPCSVYLTSLSRPHNTIHYESHPIIHSEEELNNPVAGT